jgi:glycosyltransferase involved in cell wall biosynthesis
MRISVVFTVLNEAAALPRLLDSLAAQTRPPDEVVACDGGSHDGTVELLRAERRFPMRVIESAGANISRGRNVAIAEATGDVIACTDAGVTLDRQWLEKITELLILDSRFLIDDTPVALDATDQPAPGKSLTDADADPQSKIQNPKSKIVQWVGGFFLPDTRNAFEVAMGATVLPILRDVRPGSFLPSSRSVAYRKSAWEQAGGYPEWLDYCEDLVFDLSMRELYGPCCFAPEAIAYFRPRSSLRAFYRQYYLYARGDGKANLWLKRHLIRYGTYLAALPLMLAGIAFLPTTALKGACAGALILGAAAYTRTPYRRLIGAWGKLTAREKVKAAALVPVIRVVGDVAKMIGYPAGVVWRLRRGRLRRGRLRRGHRE